MMLSRLFLASLLVAIASSVAWPCPAGSPCLKYRRMQPPTPPIVVTMYSRTVRAPVPRRDAIGFLVAATWQPIYAPAPYGGTGYSGAVAVPPRLRFVDARNLRRAIRPLPGERLVLVREVDRVDGLTFVDLDGDSFALEACPRSWNACLVRRERPISVQHFAQPPE